MFFQNVDARDFSVRDQCGLEESDRIVGRQRAHCLIRGWLGTSFKSDLDAIWMAELCNRLDHISAISKELEVFVLLLHRQIAELLVVELCRARPANFKVRFR